LLYNVIDQPFILGNFWIILIADGIFGHHYILFVLSGQYKIRSEPEYTQALKRDLFFVVKMLDQQLFDFHQQKLGQQTYGFLPYFCGMLSEKDRAFMLYWERERDKQNKFVNKLMAGLPMAFIFCLPILLLLGVVYFYLPEFYTRISTALNTSSSTMLVIVVAVFCCVLFFAYFRMHYKWEMNEQYYQALKSKESVKNQTS
jgi:hypothetical protein